MNGAYEELVEFLKTRAPDFIRAPEYQIHRGEVDDLPGVVLASLGTYLARVTREHGDTAALLLVLDEISAWNDATVQVQLRDELFEAIESEHDVEQKLRGQMTGRLRDTYEQWKTAQ